MNHDQTEQNPDAIQEGSSQQAFETVTKISDLQRMNIDQLQAYARNIGL